jgi:hypothetical protein
MSFDYQDVLLCVSPCLYRTSNLYLPFIYTMTSRVYPVTNTCSTDALYLS